MFIEARELHLRTAFQGKFAAINFPAKILPIFLRSRLRRSRNSCNSLVGGAREKRTISRLCGENDFLAHFEYSLRTLCQIMSHNILYLALNELLVKVSANLKKPDFFSLAPPALAKDYYSNLCLWIAKDFTRR